MLKTLLAVGLATGLAGAATGQEKTLYKGQDASYWGKRLLDADQETSRQAAVALSTIGAESSPFVANGCKSSIVHVRGHALGILGNAKWAKKEPKTFAPVLLMLLKDEEPGIRSGASSATAFLLFPECVDALRVAAQAETDEGTRRRMKACLEQIDQAKGK